MTVKKLLVKYSASRLATSADIGRSLGGKYVYESGEVTIVGVCLSDQFYESLRRVIAVRHPGFELVGPTLLSEIELTNELTHKPCAMTSSHGEVIFDASTGVVLEVTEEDTDDPGCLTRIYRVDVDRLRELLPDFEDRGSVDILNAGFWYVTDRGSTAYEPPEPSHSEWAAGRRETPC